MQGYPYTCLSLCMSVQWYVYFPAYSNFRLRTIGGHLINYHYLSGYGLIASYVHVGRRAADWPDYEPPLHVAYLWINRYWAVGGGRLLPLKTCYWAHC